MTPLFPRTILSSSSLHLRLDTGSHVVDVAEHVHTLPRDACTEVVDAAALRGPLCRLHLCDDLLSVRLQLTKALGEAAVHIGKPELGVVEEQHSICSRKVQTPKCPSQMSADHGSGSYAKASKDGKEQARHAEKRLLLVSKAHVHLVVAAQGHVPDCPLVVAADAAEVSDGPKQGVASILPHGNLTTELLEGVEVEGNLALQFRELVCFRPGLSLHEVDATTCILVVEGLVVVSLVKLVNEEKLTQTVGGRRRGFRCPHETGCISLRHHPPSHHATK
mmetsp:Transcript_65008/g.155259  ORF Transcript_65008/g.155259 Transcript_65008/m.155259 type:complete len:277 (+) Transcript_65008:1236-2066(+)